MQIDKGEKALLCRRSSDTKKCMNGANYFIRDFAKSITCWEEGAGFIDLYCKIYWEQKLLTM